MYFDWKKHLTLRLLSRFTDLLVCHIKLTLFSVIYLSSPRTLTLSVFSFPYLFSWQHKLTMSSHLLRLCSQLGCAFKKHVSNLTHGIIAVVYTDLTLAHNSHQLCLSLIFVLKFLLFFLVLKGKTSWLQTWQQCSHSENPHGTKVVESSL